MSHQPDEAIEVLRGVWSAQGQTSADLDEACGTTKSCKRMADVGFDGMAGADGDLRTAWRRPLDGEESAGWTVRRPSVSSPRSCAKAATWPIGGWLPRCSSRCRYGARSCWRAR